MHIKKLKVRGKAAGFKTPCAVETLNMLNCWAAFKDTNNTSKCAEAAKDLASCMATSHKAPSRPTSSLNYHLARMQKVLK